MGFGSSGAMSALARGPKAANRSRSTIARSSQAISGASASKGTGSRQASRGVPTGTPTLVRMQRSVSTTRLIAVPDTARA
jgi:hypothetical protein